MPCNSKVAGDAGEPGENTDATGEAGEALARWGGGGGCERVRK
jgi:hypothetical protein